MKTLWVPFSTSWTRSFTDCDSAQISFQTLTRSMNKYKSRSSTSWLAMTGIWTMATEPTSLPWLSNAATTPTISRTSSGTQATSPYSNCSNLTKRRKSLAAKLPDRALYFSNRLRRSAKIWNGRTSTQCWSNSHANLKMCTIFSMTLSNCQRYPIRNETSLISTRKISLGARI